MSDFLRAQYAALRSAPGLGYEIARSAAAFLVISVLTFAVCLAFPALRTLLAERVLALLGGLQVTDGQGRLSAAGLFLNNLRACGVTMLYGLLPFVYLSAMTLGSNAMILGGLAAWYAADRGSLVTFLAGTAAHGLFELPALVLSAAMGLWLCRQAGQWCMSEEPPMPPSACLAQFGRMLALVVTPLLVLAALVEAYVTPLLAGMAC